MTAGELRNLLKDLPDDQLVLVDDSKVDVAGVDRDEHLDIASLTSWTGPIGSSTAGPTTISYLVVA